MTSTIRTIEWHILHIRVFTYTYCTFNVESTANPFLEGYAIWSKVTVTFLHIFLGQMV